ncbi:MAG: LacI family DNA-binding transcriptional regulator [Spirochaetales bacterium]|nr:LacI family DNA-binding transcriptional regulator [Spirochaetales bacterium]
MDKKSTLQEISRIAGVSASTVSRVINHPELVKPDTLSKILEVIHENQMDISLRSTKRKQIIGFTFSDVHSLFTSTLVGEIGSKLVETPYQMLLFNMGSRQNVYHYFRQHLDYLSKIDGLIISSAVLDNDGVTFFRKMGIPIVLLQARCEHEKSISNNNFRGGQDAARFLISRGYTDMGFVSWEPRDEHIHDRLEGFASELRKTGLSLPESRQYSEELSMDGGYRATKQIFAEENPPQVLFYGCDYMAAGGFRYFRENGIRIPEDVGIMGFDDLEIAGAIGLTTLDQFIAKKSQMAVDYLLARLKGEELHDQIDEICITPRVVVRSSTK